MNRVHAIWNALATNLENHLLKIITWMIIKIPKEALMIKLFMSKTKNSKKVKQMKDNKVFKKKTVHKRT
jgi:hypothetical protein